MLEGWRNIGILVVGDRTNIAESLSFASRVVNATWAIEMAKNGDSARACLDINPADIVIIDACLFDDEGFRALECVRAVSNAPIFVLMTESDEMAKVKALEMGADCCLERPFTFMELIARIKGLLQLAERRKHLGTG